jgi:hypothetical protein
VDRAGDGHHVAALLERLFGGDERARLQGGFDHQRGLRQARNQPVAPWEIGGQRRRAQWVFAQDQAAQGNLVRQRAV